MAHKLERIVRLKLIEALGKLDEWSVKEERIVRSDGLWVAHIGKEIGVGNSDHEVPQMFIEFDDELRAAWGRVNSFIPNIKRERTIFKNLGIDDV